MALRKFSSDAAKRFGIVAGLQNSLRSPLVGASVEKQLSLIRKEFGSQSRNFICPSSHLCAPIFSKSSVLSRPDDGSAERSGSGKRSKGSADVPKVKERPVVYECQVCEALCVKRVQQEAFERGVVMVRCLECRSVNLVADNLGLFKEKDSMKKFLLERGVDLRYGAESSYELLAEDMIKIAEMEAQKDQAERLQPQEKGEEQQHQQHAY
ncbi:hypothetical protein R1flu_018105 [Riccia fluitans]|uniref:DNL-type domain-containing protein n=1 Tax=Riccia fluitans TaxID=41844 RepID=A0ABD1ZF37_9MARC